MMERFALGLTRGGVSFVCKREEVETVERKRPSSSSMGIGGVVDMPLIRDDFESGG